MNLASLLEMRAGRHPDRPALVDASGGRDRVLTFAELARAVEAGAALLHRLGLRRGDSVLVFQPVSLELYEFLLAAFRSGLRVVLADPSAGRPFLDLCCRRVAPNAFFGSWKAQLLRISSKEMRRIPLVIGTGGYFPGVRRWKTEVETMAIVDVTDDEPALITFTSGGTGVPKAAVRTHGFLMAQHRALSKALDFEEGEVDLVTLPVFVLANLASGLTSVLAATNLARPGDPDVSAVRAQCARHGVTRCAASPAFFEGFLASGGGMFPLRKLFTGGAPVFPDLLSRLRSACPGARIDSVYGSTEAEPIAHFPAVALDEGVLEMTASGGGLCAGRPVPEIDARVIRDCWGTALGPMDHEAFEGMVQPPLVAGEIVVAGEHVLPGYLDGRGDEETKIHVGGRVWHRTGDAGWVDRDGRIWLLGRCAERLPSCASTDGLPQDSNRYPFGIECAMRAVFPQFRTAALDWRGARCLVCARKPDSADQESLQTRAEALGIERVIHVESLPMDRRHNAKIDYPELRRMLERLERGTAP